MFEQDPFLGKSASRAGRLLTGLRSLGPREGRQRGLMVSALVLLLVALGVVLYLDRDFWFPDAIASDDDLQQADPAVSGTADASVAIQQAEIVANAPHVSKKSKRSNLQPYDSVPEAASDPPFATVTQRTVLTPLAVEVVAGDTHRMLQPSNNLVHVDLQADASTGSVASRAASEPDSGAAITSNAAEHIQMSGNTSEVVSQSVRPDYPLLARQMKVQGSVILEALISREGRIQSLHVLSGPPILADAAQEAVRQWHFKPHFQGADVVETQARITVNFTISTN